MRYTLGVPSKYLGLNSDLSWFYTLILETLLEIDPFAWNCMCMKAWMEDVDLFLSYVKWSLHKMISDVFIKRTL